MNCYCYILFSNSLNRFYTGISRELNERILKHNDHSYSNNRFTAKANDWELFLAIECTCLSIARKIELHIKRMKSSSYIRNLKNDPALVETLKARYSLLEHQVLGLCHSEVLPDIYHSPMPGTCQLDLKDAILSASFCPHLCLTTS